MAKREQITEQIESLDEVDAQDDLFLTFPLGNEEMAIEIRNVIEIVGIQNVTVLPDMPPYVKGVINLRGKVIPVIDVRLRFGFTERNYDERTCIVVVSIRGFSVGLIVDSVSEVLNIPTNSIEPSPKVKNGESSRYIKGLGKVGEHVKIILNIEELLINEDIQLLQDSLAK